MVRQLAAFALLAGVIGGCLRSAESIRAEAGWARDAATPAAEGACIERRRAFVTHRRLRPRRYQPALRSTGDGAWHIWLPSQNEPGGLLRLHRYGRVDDALFGPSHEVQALIPCESCRNQLFIDDGDDADPGNDVIVSLAPRRETCEDRACPDETCPQADAARCVLDPAGPPVRLAVHTPSSGVSGHAAPGHGLRVLSTDAVPVQALAAVDRPGAANEVVLTDLSNLYGQRRLTRRGRVIRLRDPATATSAVGICIVGIDDTSADDALNAYVLDALPSLDDVPNGGFVEVAAASEGLVTGCQRPALWRTASHWVALCTHDAEDRIEVLRSADCLEWQAVDLPEGTDWLDLGSDRTRAPTTALAVGPEGGFVGAWAHPGSVATVVFAEDGTPLHGIRLATADGDGTMEADGVAIAGDGAGGYLVAWIPEDGDDDFAPEIALLDCAAR